MKEESFKDLMVLSCATLQEEIVQNRRVLLNFRLKKKSEPVKPHLVRQVRKKIARLKTALNLKLFEGVEGE